MKLPMKAKHIFIYCFSLLVGGKAMAQEEEKTPWNYKPNFMVGVDVLNAGISFFGERHVFQGFISSQVKDNIHALVEAGYESNTYDKNGYDADAKGPFLKIGGFYMLAKDRENEFNGFYAGAKIAASFYEQTYHAIPIRGYAGSTASEAFPSSRQSSYWLEGTIGGRVQLFDTNFYIDVSAQPRYWIYSTKQDDIIPMIIPGFGKSSNKFNMGFAWNIAYKF